MSTGGNRHYWAFSKGVNVCNGNLREFFYLDTSDIHAKIPNKQKFLRKLLDKDNSGTTISSFTYELDLAGNRLGVTDNEGKYTRLISDPSLQLRTETKWSSKTSSSRSYQYGFAYDENGNRITQHKDGVLTNYSYGDNNEILTAGSDTFTHDLFGNIATKVSGGNTTTFGYDFERHLTSIDFPSTANDDSHQYDGDGVRMRSKLAGAADWTNFIQCPVTGALLGEYTLIGGAYTITAVNTWGNGLISTNRSGTKRYFHFDGSGSTVALTDASGSVTDTYSYSAFGVLETTTGTSINPFRFKGMSGAYDDGAMGSPQGAVMIRRVFYLPVFGLPINTPGNGGVGFHNASGQPGLNPEDVGLGENYRCIEIGSAKYGAGSGIRCWTCMRPPALYDLIVPIVGILDPPCFTVCKIYIHPSDRPAIAIGVGGAIALCNQIPHPVAKIACIALIVGYALAINNCTRANGVTCAYLIQPCIPIGISSLPTVRCC